MRAFLATALLITACSGERAPIDPCTARLDALEARLARAARYVEPSGAPSDVALATGRGAPLEGAPPILVVADEVVLDGRGIGGGDELDPIAATLGRDLASLEETYGESEEPWLVGLWIERETSVERLTTLLSLAPPRVRFAILVRARDVRPRPWVLSALRGDPYQRRERFERLWTRATETCPSAREHLPREIDVLGIPTGPASTERLMTALRACGCDNAGLGATEAIAVTALLGTDGGVARLPHAVRFGPATGPGEELEVPADATARDLVQRLARVRANDETVWITAE